MRTEKELILATKTFAKENRLISWAYTLSTLLILIGLVIGTIWKFHWIGKLVCSILVAFVMVRMFVIYHDYQHKSILENSIIAKIIMAIYGILVLNPPSIWKRSHDYHHKHNSKLFSASIGSYPIMTKSKFLSASRGEKFEYLATRHPLTILFGYIFMFIYGMCFNSFLYQPKKHWDAGFALILHFIIIGIISWFGDWQTLIFTIFIPFFISSAMGAYLFYAQHNFPGVTFKNSNKEWNYFDASMESSSYMKMNRIMRWFMANIGYHHIHHLNSRIPFYRLPEAMEKVPEFQNVKTTSLHPIEIFRCLRLKLWDAESNKMIGLFELKKG